MTDYSPGPPRTYEITWKTGHIEQIQGHQVIFDSHRINAGLWGNTPAVISQVAPRFTIHGEISGHWRLVLTAPEEDLISIRDVTVLEVPAEETPS